MRRPTVNGNSKREPCRTRGALFKILDSASLQRGAGIDAG